MVDSPPQPTVEIQSLRDELRMRILFQNALLQGQPVVFAGLVIAAAALPLAAPALCFGFQCVMLAGAMQWCHHGVRTAQIKRFLQEINDDGNHGTWETWLPAHRPQTLLGSRWLISTKGVFLGLGAAMILLDLIAFPGLNALLLAGACLVWGIAAGLLFTNPKE